MPITLGCPACGKKFRARDESAGKRVKCPYCSAPVPVPAAGEEEQQFPPSQGHSPLDDDRPAPPQAPGRSPLDDDEPGIGQVPTSRPNPLGAAPVSPPADWGADPIDQQRPKPFPPAASPPPPPAFPPPPPQFPPKGASSPGFDMFPKPGAAAARPGRESSPKLGAGRALGAGLAGGPSPKIGMDAAKGIDPATVPGWRKARSGLFWVMFGLFLLVIPGTVGFAKFMCVKNGVALPKGPGGDWVKIQGWVNTDEAGSVLLPKEELLDLAAYGVPVLLGGLLLGFGRLTCGAAPRSGGSKGMFALSGLFTLVAVAALLAAFVSDKLFPEYSPIARPAFLISVLAAEVWFLTGLAVSGVAVNRPQAARAVGMFWFVVVLLAVTATIGWTLYVKHGRPLRVPDTTKLYEEAAFMLGWLFLIAAYWRAVRSVRKGISEYLEAAPIS